MEMIVITTDADGVIISHYNSFDDFMNYHIKDDEWDGTEFDNVEKIKVINVGGVFFSNIEGVGYRLKDSTYVFLKDDSTALRLEPRKIIWELK